MSALTGLRVLLSCALMSVGGAALAQDLPPTVVFDPTTLAAAPPSTGQPPPQHFSVTSYGDADSLGNRTVYADGTIAPFSGIYESGLRFRAMGDVSWYRYVNTESPRTLGSGHYVEGDILAGYGIWLSRFSITGLVGPAFADIVNQGVVTERWGARAAIEMNAKPTDWTMASASVFYSTPTNNVQAQVKTGLKIFEGVYVGPEAKFSWQQLIPVQLSFVTPSVAAPSFVTSTPVSAQTAIAKVNVGAFSAVNVGPVAIGVSGGWVQEQQLGSGFYGSASLYIPF